MSSAPTSKPVWLTYLDEKQAGTADGPGGQVFQDVILMLRNYLQDTDSPAAPDEAAKRIDAYYSETYEPKFDGSNGSKKGWTGYLSILYGVFLATAQRVPYDDLRQDKMVDLMLALRALPPKSCRIWLVSDPNSAHQPLDTSLTRLQATRWEWLDTTVWTDEPLFALALDSAWTSEHGGYVSDDVDWDDPESIRSHEDKCNQWVSYCAFRARCMVAKLDEALDLPVLKLKGGRWEYPLDAIQLGLEDDHLLEYGKLKCHVVGAAQYTLLAGEVIHTSWVTTRLHGFSPERWKVWADKFGEIAELKEERVTGGPGDLRHMALQAREKMIVLQPELFPETKTGEA